MSGTRINEWFVPGFGPPKFRAFVGLLFLPYTGMCVCFAIIGATLVDDVHWDRVGAIALIYALALGVGAHAADTIGSKKAKPWGSYFTKRQMLALLALSLVAAYAVGIYYIVLYVPLLAIAAVLEGFFLLAYNFEIWGGRFHNDFWFAISWGALPVMAGYLIQTDSISLLPFAVAGAAALTSFAEIRMSRPYKQLKKVDGDWATTASLEKRLKTLSLSTIAISLAFMVARLLL
ncbi:hypothetical protein [Nitrososphaera sp.]|uniref:hypothetical protein n=1 Tax=Nitrososphaera sp. TaxID=1971748 RepID=UPI002ED8C7CF